MTSNAFVHKHRVRYHEIDAQQLVYNARYFEYFDVAMTEYFRSLGWGYPAMLAAGLDPSVVRAEVDFRRPALLDDMLEVRAECAAVGDTSFRMDFEVERMEPRRLLASALIIYVNVDPATHAKRLIPETFRARMLGATDTPTPDADD